MRNRSSTNNIILAIKHIEVKVEPGYPSSGPQAELAAVHIDKPLPPKHNTLTAHQQGQVGHNVEHQKHLYNNAGDNGDEVHAGNVAQSGATLNFGVHEGLLQTFDPRDQALLDPEKPYDQRWQEKHRAPGPGNDRSPTS
ncbi:LOW QUALITY PROTEIN: hypothetical protein FOPG_11215 [Fusarium oxysporum f. sp. conglutinans race 2 54008]|uniref:Uncharacterized protein n=1 Tax=Fusarium oxysporum f. sp. conglutinans race 2 54008 TaxID=1089457 RepID=X0HBA8_FUSOX|nr:LOW QUALITY PROTEIN: hypothetical protein FOPG_11215 [Fusarium oxysporum f. sp. conglutinans race 2 54008]